MKIEHILGNYYEIGGRVFRELAVTDGKCKLHIGDKQVWYRPSGRLVQNETDSPNSRRNVQTISPSSQNETISPTTRETNSPSGETISPETERPEENETDSPITSETETNRPNKEETNTYRVLAEEVGQCVPPNETERPFDVSYMPQYDAYNFATDACNIVPLDALDELGIKPIEYPPIDWDAVVRQAELQSKAVHDSSGNTIGYLINGRIVKEEDL